MAAPKIAYYITAHGYGHGARSCDILSALMDITDPSSLHIVSDLPPDFLRDRLPAEPGGLHARSFDVGMVQKDSVQVDLKATEDRLRRWLETRPGAVIAERKWIEGQDLQLVVADIPSIPIESAAGAGCPAWAVGNFSWDWIYADFADRDPVWAEARDAFAEGYQQCSQLLRLPFSAEMEAFPVHSDLPLVARPGRSRRSEIAESAGCDPDRPWVLLSFTTLDWGPEALDRVRQLTDWQFLTVAPLAWEGENLFEVDRRMVPFPDVVASSDIVLTKPGFGILSECAVNRTPIVYVERTDFAEYPILEAALKRVLRHVHIPSEDLYAGYLEPYLHAVEQVPEPLEHLASGGDRRAARMMLEAAEGRMHG